MEKAYLCTVLQETAFIAGWSSPVARQAHNLKVVGSNPAPATIKKALRFLKAFFVCLIIMEKRLSCEIVELFLACTISHLYLCCFGRE